MRPSNMMSLDAVSARIRAGENLLLAGDEAVLAKLPPGNWIAGTTPYFHDVSGAHESQELIAVDRLPSKALGMRIELLPADEVTSLAKRARPHEYIYLIVPGFSAILEAFATHQHDIEQILNQPVIGWVSGAPLEQLGKQPAKVFDGRSVKAYNDAIVVAYVALPPDAQPLLDVINVFTPSDAPTITFEQDGFEQTHALIDGKRMRIVDALREHGHDTRWPLVSDYAGARFNVAFKTVDDASGKVSLYAPVFAGMEYRFAQPLADYRGALTAKTKQLGSATHHANVCILHHVLAQLDGHKLGEFDASMVFGEIAYILHNQTVVYLTV